MPKLKTKSGAKKRFSRTATGKIKMNVAHKRHRLISKPKQMKRHARGTTTLQKGDAKLGLTSMPYLRGCGAERWPGSNAGLPRMPGTRRGCGAPTGYAASAAPPARGALRRQGR